MLSRFCHSYVKSDAQLDKADEIKTHKLNDNIIKTINDTINDKLLMGSNIINAINEKISM